MLPLARRNLFRDKVRFSVTLTGIVFAVVLIVIQLGLFVGFSVSTTCLIDNSGADLWVTSKHVPYVELGVPFNESKFYEVKAVPGVLHAEKFISRFTQWKRRDGRQESVQIVGFDRNSGMGGPWNLVAGSLDSLAIPDGIIVDDSYRTKLGTSRLGEVFELGGHRARIVGYTHGIRTFTTAPYVFTTFKRAQDFVSLRADKTVYVLVKVAPGVELEQVRHDILAAVRNVDVLTSREFSAMTRAYWMFTTGAGVALLIAAMLGLVVGFVIVAQTIYATTMDHLREFGTLKAMGAPNSYVYRVIVKQAGISAVIGYALGMLTSILVIMGGQRGGASILVPWQMAVGIFFLTLLMCLGAALVSINKIMRLDPALVFKG